MGRGEGERPNRRRETMRGVEARALSGTGSERGRGIHAQDSGEGVGETLAAAEGRGGGCRWEGHTRCSCRETSGDSRGRKGNTGERRREGGKEDGTGGGSDRSCKRSRRWEDGMEPQPPGHLGDGRTVSCAVARFVQEGGVPTRREIGCGCKVAGLRGKEEGFGGSDDLTDPKLRIPELAAYQVAAGIGGVGAFGGRIRQDRVRGGIFKRKERIGEVVEGVGDAGGPCARDKDNVAAVVGEGGTDIGTDTMVVPRLAP